MTEPNYGVGGKSVPVTETSKPKDKETDVAFVKNVAIIFYRSPVVWQKKDIEYLRENGILVIKSKNLRNDIAVADITTYQAVGQDGSLALINKAALATVGYNTETFAKKVLELVRAQPK